MFTSKPIAAVIMPTCNEAGNITSLITFLCEKIFPHLEHWDAHIVVVDGNSSDNTVEQVQERTRLFPQVHLIIEEKKEGIGAAYIKGFRYSIEILKADALIEFDADWQHPPETIPRLLKKLDEGFDYCVGSRNIRGGSNGRRTLPRLLFTTVGGFVARFILFFPGKYFWLVTDPTSGLKCTRVKNCADKLDLRVEHLYSREFGYKVQLLSETLRTGARYAEIPFIFGSRRAGKSKFNSRVIVDILLSCLKARFALNSRKI